MCSFKSAVWHPPVAVAAPAESVLGFSNKRPCKRNYTTNESREIGRGAHGVWRYRVNVENHDKVYIRRRIRVP